VLPEDYASWLAALCIRDRDFAARNADLVLAFLPHLFSDQDMQDIVNYGLQFVKESGHVLPLPALRLDLDLAYGISNEAGRNRWLYLIYKHELTGQAHAEESLREVAASRALEAIPKDLTPETFFAAVEEVRIKYDIKSMARKTPMRLDEAIERAIADGTNVKIGVPTGYETLDSCLNGGGVCQGEMLVVRGPANSGKSTFLICVAAHAVLRGYSVFFISYETGDLSTRERFIRAIHSLTGSDDISGLPICIHYSPDPYYKPVDIEFDARKLAVRYGWGETPDLIIRDYGEIAATTPDDYHAVRNSYLDLKRVCGRLRCGGLDAAQENRSGQLSYHDIRKDMDIIVRLLPSADKDVIMGTIDRNREGPKDSGWRMRFRPTLASLQEM
jgi:hypothetical protein